MRWRSKLVIYEHPVLCQLCDTVTTRLWTLPEAILQVQLQIKLGGKLHVAEPPLALDSTLRHHGRCVNLFHMHLKVEIVPKPLPAFSTLELLLFQSPARLDLSRFGLGGPIYTLGRISN